MFKVGKYSLDTKHIDCTPSHSDKYKCDLSLCVTDSTELYRSLVGLSLQSGIINHNGVDLLTRASPAKL